MKLHTSISKTGLELRKFAGANAYLVLIVNTSVNILLHVELFGM